MTDNLIHYGTNIDRDFMRKLYAAYFEYNPKAACKAHRMINYFEAIKQCLGYEDLHVRPRFKYDGVIYTFDFYHPEPQCQFKIFKDGKLANYGKYTNLPFRCVLIVDAEGLKPSAEWRLTEAGAELVVSGKFGKRLCDDHQPYLYFERRLWEFKECNVQGLSVWTPVIPRSSNQEVE